MPDQNAQTLWIDLEKIDLPVDARTHDPEILATLTQDMKEQGQLQEIIVTPVGERFEVIAGVGRVTVARKLGWSQIRASVRPGLSDFEKARITFAENEDREDADPFYQASRIMKMLNDKPNRQELAKNLGISDSLIDAYVSVDQLPPEIKSNPKRLGLGCLIQITRINEYKDKIRLARKAINLGLSVRQLKAIVDKMTGTTVSKSKKKVDPAKVDPMSTIWALAKESPASAKANWEVSYPQDETWTFKVSPMGGDYAGFLAGWFLAMGAAIQANDPLLKNEEPAEAQPQETPAIEQQMKAGDEAWSTHLRLPKNSAEEQELESAAKQGPANFYAWIYGPDSPYPEQVKGITWQEVTGFSDPHQACQMLLQALRDAEKNSQVSN